MSLFLSDFVAVELFEFVPAVSIVLDAIPAGAKVVHFGDDGVVAISGDSVERYEFVVPYRAGMTELVVERATITVAGRRVDQAPVTQAKNSASPSLTLSGRVGALRQLDVRGLAVVPSGAAGVALTATVGSTNGFSWTSGEGGSIAFARTSSGNQLHFLVRPDDGAGDFGPPATAVPHYDMPDNSSGLYGPVLAGAALSLDNPTVGAARVTFDPPIAAAAVEVFLGNNDKAGVHEGLPHETTGVNWTATEVAGVWASAPTAVKLSASAGTGEPVLVADLPGELRRAPTDVDFTPAARAVLSDVYKVATSGDLVLGLAAASDTAGDLVATSLFLEAHYRLDSIGADGVPVVLRGSPASVDLPIAPGLVPARLVLTVDGRFGPAARVAASDLAQPGRRSGLRIAGSARGARRITLTAEERARPLTRLSLFGRADEPTEVVLTLLADRNGRTGSPLGPPVALQIDPALEPAWHRAELTVPTAPPGVDAVWITVQASTGRFAWFADAAIQGDEAQATTTDDAGATWSTIAARPVVQVHYLTERPQPSPLRVDGPDGMLTSDVLALPAVRSRVETTLLDALKRGLASDASSAAALGAAPTSVTFRKEGVQPLPELDVLGGFGDRLRLTFDSERDADFRVLDAVVTYDPWAAP